MADDLNTPRISDWIDGGARNSGSGEAFGRLNLNDGIACRFAANGSTEDMLDAVSSANRAFASFSERMARDRERRLRKTGELAEFRKVDFADGSGSETGPPVEKAGFEFLDAFGMPLAVMRRRAVGATRLPDRCLTASPAFPSSAPAAARAAAKALKPTRGGGRNDLADNDNSRAAV